MLAEGPQNRCLLYPKSAVVQIVIVLSCPNIFVQLIKHIKINYFDKTKIIAETQTQDNI